MQANVLLACNESHASKKEQWATRIIRIIVCSYVGGEKGEIGNDTSCTLGTLAVNQYLA